MIGLGILEFSLLVAGGAYIYSLLSRKNRIQYIELDQNQFQSLQTTLVANNILPTYMLVNTDPNSTVIPPTYDESNLNYALTQSRESTPPTNSNNNSHPAMLEVSAQSDSIMDAPAYSPLPNMIPTSQQTSQQTSQPESNEEESQILLPSSNLYPSITN